MAKVGKETETKNSLVKQFFILLLLLFIVFLFVSSLFGDKGFLEVRRAKVVYNELDKEIASLKKENEQLLKEINELQNSSGIIEKIAREDLKMAKEGEDLYIFID